MEVIRDLAAFCTQHLWEEKIIVASSRSVGMQLRERIMREGGSWLNLHADTLPGIARRVLGNAHLACSGLLTEAQALCLLEETCSAADGDLSLFADLAASRGFHRAVFRSIEDCLLADLDPAGLSGSAFATPEKAQAFRVLASRFIDACRSGGLYTEAMFLHLAAEQNSGAEMSNENMGASAPCIILIDETMAATLAPAARRLLETAGTVQLFRIERKAPSDLRYRRANDEECELRAVLREVLQQGTRWDEVEIVLSRKDLLPLAFEMTRLYDIPTTFDPGVPLHYSKAARTVVAWLRWMTGGYDAAWLIRMMYDGVPAPYEREVNGVKGGRLQMAHLIRASAAGWGRSRLMPQIARAIEDMEARKGSPDDRSVLQARANEAWLRQLLDVTPETEDGLLSLRRTAAGARHLIMEMSRDKYPGEKEAMQRLAEMLSEYASAPDLHLAPQRIAHRLIEDISAAVFPMVLQQPGTPPMSTTRPLPGHLHVSLLECGGWCGRQHTYAIGMDAQSVPVRPPQNPVLLDEERRRITVHTDHPLPLTAHATERSAHVFADLLQRVPGSCTLSWPAQSMTDGAARFPSRLLLETLRSVRGDEQLGYEELYAAAGDGVGIVPTGQPLSLAEWFLSSRAAVEPKVLAAQLYEHSPLLREGARAEAQRQSAAFTPWDGLVGDAVPPAAPVYSASSLQQLASCPYTWFLERRLGLREPAPWNRDDRIWLDAMEHGSLLHHVLYRFMTLLQARGEHPDPARHEKVLQEIAHEAMNLWERDVPVPNRPARLAEERRLLAECAIFLREEEHVSGRPVLLETAFGLDDEEDAIPLETPQSSVLLRGRIDRADRESDGSITVWDYKSGNVTSTPAKPLNRGRDLQHAIYAHAARTLLQRRGESPATVTAGYYALSEKSQGRKVLMPDCSAELPQIVGMLDTLRAEQVFPHSRDVRDCSYCRFQSVCGTAAHIVAQTRDKLDLDENTVLEPFRRLNDVR